MEKSAKTTVVVTGFGIFRDYASNPSWEAIKLMNVDHPGVDLVKIEIPVIYDVTEKEVNRIWSEYKPALVVHCGVSHLATCLTLEKRAVQNVERYCSPDVTSCKPLNGVESASDIQYLYTGLDLDQVCSQVNYLFEAGRTPISACVSNCAGEYLCEYIYRCSLQKDSSRTLFIHVPKIGEQVTVEDIAAGLQVAIESILDQLTN